MASPATLQPTGTDPQAKSRHGSASYPRAFNPQTLLEMVEVRKREVTEKYYRAKQALFASTMILPKTKVCADCLPAVTISRLESIARHLEKHFHVLNFPVGSLDWPRESASRDCGQFSGAAIFSMKMASITLSTVPASLPDRDVEMVTLAYRHTGINGASGESKSIQEDQGTLSAKDVRFY